MHASNLKFFIALFGMLTITTACGDEEDTPVVGMPEDQFEGPLFQLLDHNTTGLNFTNKVEETAQMNYFKYEYAYNGGGVAIGDVNNDRLPDLYFTGNSVPNKLFINKGNLTFEDVTATAFAGEDNDWSSGVTMTDINGDGWQDIYVCLTGPSNEEGAQTNKLFVNQKDGTFKEEAAKYGIADSGHSTQAAFFDYDKDGDLDLYVMNHFTDFTNQKYIEDLTPDQAKTDRLYKRDGDTFTDVTMEAGILNHACGLGLSIADLNNDGWPDIYVANDYDEADFFYVNQKDGTFKNEIEGRMKHISNFGMGTDVGDFNNDGLPDLVELDMAFSDHVRSKRNMASMSTEKFWSLVNGGKHFQYMSNTLQLNVGNNTFAEIAQMAGVARTDWSWAPLFADFDNDGWKDLFITNGYKRDIRDRDFQNTLEAEIAARGSLSFEESMGLAPRTIIRNQIYRNNGDLTFSDATDDWGLTEAFNSNGAAYGDLDNDGDLDLVVNNMESVVSLYENSASQNGNDYVQVKLKGPSANPSGIGARVKVKSGVSEQMIDVAHTRGYQSSVSPEVHFGLGSQANVDISVIWPDGKESKVTATSGIVEIDYNSATAASPDPKTYHLSFQDISQNFPFTYMHQENKFNDFEKEILLPHMQSRNGPFFTIGDVNGDGFDDMHISGAKGISGSILLQSADGNFGPAPSAAFEVDKGSEDQGSHFFDADGDGDLDLYVVSGGNDFATDDPLLQDRLYLNNGQGEFSKAEGALPAMISSGMTVISNDIDGDGDLDLFVGGRLVPGHYPQSPESYLLINNGGKFENQTAALAPDLQRCGMVNRAVFGDFNGDGKTDLAFAGEWNAVRLFIQEGGKLVDHTNQWGLSDTKGLWFALKAVDVDSDGDLDLVAGNLGKNNKFKASKEKPFNIYAKDFDDNGTWDVVLSKYQGDINYPVRGRECTSEQMPFIAEKFPSYQAFAEADMSTLYTDEKLTDALHLEVYTFKSKVFINNGNGFRAMPLPNEAQVSVLMDFVVTDINADGHPDLVAAGNMFDAEVETVRYDAGCGVVLIGDGKGNFEAVPSNESGFFAPANVRNLSAIKIAGNPVILVGNNRQKLAAFLSRTEIQ